MKKWHGVMMICAATGIFCLTATAAPKRDLEVERIEAQLAQFNQDQERARLVPAEIAWVEDALQLLRETPRRSAALRQHRSYLTERRLDIAIAASELLLAEKRIVELDRERDKILLDASRRDAELARLEAEKLRVQSLASAEEAERIQRQMEAARAEIAENAAAADAARSEADQARRVAQAQSEEAELARREAELANAAVDSLRVQMESLKAKEESRGLVMTLGESVFASGQSAMQPEALQHLDKIIEFVNQDETRDIRIEGHTDTSGNTRQNQILSQKRADSVKRALIELGVDPARITSLGRGAEVPIANNKTAAGRARNRRVEIILLSH